MEAYISPWTKRLSFERYWPKQSPHLAVRQSPHRNPIKNKKAKTKNAKTKSKVQMGLLRHFPLHFCDLFFFFFVLAFCLDFHAPSRSPVRTASRLVEAMGIEPKTPN